MIYEHALDLVDVTTKALKAAVAVRGAKGSTAIPHVESLMQAARGCWKDACTEEQKSYDEAHAPAPSDVDPDQESLPLDTPADPGAVAPLEPQPGDPEWAAAPTDGDPVDAAASEPALEAPVSDEVPL